MQVRKHARSKKVMTARRHLTLRSVSRIRKKLIRYMKEHRIGVPELAQRIDGLTPAES